MSVGCLCLQHTDYGECLKLYWYAIHIISMHSHLLHFSYSIRVFTLSVFLYCCCFVLFCCTSSLYSILLHHHFELIPIISLDDFVSFSSAQFFKLENANANKYTNWSKQRAIEKHWVKKGKQIGKFLANTNNFNPITMAERKKKNSNRSHTLLKAKKKLS